MKKNAILASFTLLVSLAAYAEADRPVAVMGFGTDVRNMASDVLTPGRYVYEVFCDQWLDPKDYGKYAVLYFGEKMDGAAKGHGFRDDDEARAALEKYLAGGGTVVVAGRSCMNQLFGKPRKTDSEELKALRGKVCSVEACLGRMKANFSKQKKSLGFADDVGNFIVTPEGQQVKELTEKYAKIFAGVKGVKKIPLEGKWEVKALGTPGTLKPPTHFPKRPVLGKPVARPDGLVLLDGSRKAVIVVPPDQEKDCRKVAEELAWHLEQMSGETFQIVDAEPKDGPALIYRSLACPQDFARGPAAYFKIWREGEKVYLAGEDTGKSRATTYVLEALGCRYIWPGESGKIIPRKTKIVLPEIAVEDATSFVIRRLRLYRRPEWRDRPENRDFYRWHGLNDNSFMTTDKPGEADGYEWGHYYKDYYRKYYTEHRDWFALQPDSTRTLRLGSHPERPTFCLSNDGLAKETAERIKKRFRECPEKKCLSICLPDGATSTQCMCENCRRLDPVNAAPGRITVFFPERHVIPYVASTDRVFDFMNRITAEVVKEFPGKYLSCYAYGGYTAPPVKTVPHPNLIVLSVAGYYTGYADDDAVERNLAAWTSFGNKVLWRPNAHGGFYFVCPDNLGRRMFNDISLMDANGVFGVDYDTMSGEWATKPFVYYMVARAHYNPDRLDYDSIADDYCRSGFGSGWKSVRRYFDLIGEACDRASKLNAKSPPATCWEERVARRVQLPRQLDFDRLDRCLAEARDAAKGDERATFRINRLQFANDLGRKMLRLALEKVSDEEKEQVRKFIADYLAKDTTAYPADHDRLKVK